MKNEELQRLVFETLGACSWEYDLPADRVAYSDEYLALIGYAPGEIEITPEWVAASIHPEDLSQWRNAFVACIKGRSRYFDCELRFRRKNRHYLWIQTRGIVTDRDDDGRALRIIGMVFDISERKTAKESELRYRLFLNSIPDAISLKDRDGRYLYINRSFEDWLGKPSHQIYGQTADEIFDSGIQTLEQLREHERKVWEEGETVSMERQFPLTGDGQFRHAVITKFPICDESGEILAIGTTNTDVTERFLAQAALRESEERHRLLFEAAPAVLIESDWSKGKALIDSLQTDGVSDIGQYLLDHPELLRRRDQVIEINAANREALQVFQVESMEEFIDIMSGELDEEQRRSTIEDLVNFAAGERRSRVRTHSFRKNGEEFAILREVEIYGRDAGDWSRMLVTLRDVSADEAVRESEKRLRQLYELAPAVLVESDWSAGKALIDKLRSQGVDDLERYLVEHPELTRRRDQIMRMTSVNREALKVYRADSAEALIEHAAGEMNQTQRLGMIEDLVNFANGQRRSSVSCRTFRLDGEEFPIEAESEFYGDPDDWTKVLLTVRDTSAEEAVRLNEQRYRELFESAPAVLCETDWSEGKALIDRLRAEGVTDFKNYLLDHPELIPRQDQVMQVLSVNHEALQIYRADSEAQLIEYAAGELNEFQRRALIEELCNFASGQGRSIIESHNWRLDGEEFPVVRVAEIYGADPGDWSQVLLTVRDTSAEETVRLSEERYRRLFESAPAVLGESDWSVAKKLVEDLRAQGVEDVIQYLIDHPEVATRRRDFMELKDVNQESMRVFRADSKETLINFLNRPLEPAVRLGIIEDLANFVRGERRSTVRAWVPSATGDRIPIVRVSEIYSSSLEDWSQVLISIRDISKEEAVRMSEIRFRRLFESAPAALYETDWSKGKDLVDGLIEQGVDDVRQYLQEHPGLIQRMDDVLTTLNANDDAILMFRSDDKESHVRFIEGKVRDDLRLELIEVLTTFAEGKRRAQFRTRMIRHTGEEFPVAGACELISSDRDDWSLVLVSIQDMSIEEEAARQLEAYQEELRSLAGKISSAEESERRRISSELHDGTIQNLVLARIYLANLRNSLENDASLGLADSINELLESSLEETRSLIFEISPPVLYELGLEPAVEWLAEHYRKRTGVGVRITSDQQDTKLGEEMNIVLFQTARELLVNIAKHASARSVNIDWQHLQDHVVLTVEDDGVGFDVESPRVNLATEGGFGLFAIRERLKLMGASIDIQSSPKGTRVTINAPARAGAAASAAAV